MTFLADLIRLLPAVLILQFALVLIFLAFGIAKFADYEQKAIGSLVADHPVLRHGPKLMGEAGFSRLLGTVELITAVLLLLGMVWSAAGFWGGLLGAGTFVVTLSLLPFVQYFQAEAGKAFLSSRGQFLFKDLVLLGGCLAVAQYHAGLLV